MARSFSFASAIWLSLMAIAFLYSSKFFSMSYDLKLICSSLGWCIDFISLLLLIIISIFKFEMLISVSLSPNSIWLLLSSIKLILKLNKSFKDVIVNGKQMCFLLFIYFYSSYVVLIHIDWPLIPSFQLFILLWSIIPRSP